MKLFSISLVATLLLQISALSSQESQSLLHRGKVKPQVGLWKALHRQELKLKNEVLKGDNGQKTFSDTYSGSHEENDFEPKDPRYPAKCFEQPLDHFDSDNNVTFCQRYWISTEYYQKGNTTPVYILDGGETSGANRLPFLQQGILQLLSSQTSGISIVLEHRYYGKSLPSKKDYPEFDFSTDNLRFLNNEQAELDNVRFIKGLNKIIAEELQLDLDLDLVKLGKYDAGPVIYYGGSYAGARAAHMKVGWPDLIWGAIASSAVTHAQTSFPEYSLTIQQWGPEKCIKTLENTISSIDVILDQSSKLENSGSVLGLELRKRFQGLFGLEGLEYADDFGAVLSEVIGDWQGRNWDDKVGSKEFYNFCDQLTSGGAESKIGPISISASIKNYGDYIREKVVSRCPVDDETGERDVEDCFGSHDDSKFLDTGRDQEWRLWLFQVCTQWGYFQHAPLEGPRIISRLIDLNYTSKICTQAYPPGEYFQVPTWPDVESVNARGDFDIAADRLAFIDGDSDPWRPATPQSDYAKKRNSSILRPVKLIKNAVHHFDENGLLNHSKEPKRIREVHALEVEFVKSWIEDWKKSKL